MNCPIVGEFGVLSPPPYEGVRIFSVLEDGSPNRPT